MQSPSWGGVGWCYLMETDLLIMLLVRDRIPPVVLLFLGTPHPHHRWHFCSPRSPATLASPRPAPGPATSPDYAPGHTLPAAVPLCHAAPARCGRRRIGRTRCRTEGCLRKTTSMTQGAHWNTESTGAHEAVGDLMSVLFGEHSSRLHVQALCGVFKSHLFKIFGKPGHFSPKVDKHLNTDHICPSDSRQILLGRDLRADARDAPAPSEPSPGASTIFPVLTCLGAPHLPPCITCGPVRILKRAFRRGGGSSLCWTADGAAGRPGGGHWCGTGRVCVSNGRPGGGLWYWVPNGAAGHPKYRETEQPRFSGEYTGPTRETALRAGAVRID